MDTFKKQLLHLMFRELYGKTGRKCGRARGSESFFEIMSRSNIRIYTHKLSSIFKTMNNIHCTYDSQFPFILKMLK